MILEPIHYLATLGRKPARSTTRRSSATGAAGMLRRLPPCAGGVHGAWPVHAGSCGSCNSWASIP